MGRSEMEKNKKLIITDNTVYTVGFLRQVSWHTLQTAKKIEHGSFLNCMASIVFSAFTLEAYFNYLGENIIPFWAQIEKLSPSKKLEILAIQLSSSIDYSRRPFQSFNLIFRARNSLAHGKTESVTENNILAIPDDFEPDLPQADWQKLISLKNAEQFLDDTKEMIEYLHNASGLKFNPLMIPEMGGFSISAVIENDEPR